MAIFTLWKERYDETWLEIFDILWSRVLGSVVLVWFGYQALESAMSAYQAYLDWREARLKAAEEKGRREAEARLQKAGEKGRREAKDLLRNWIENDLRKQGKPEEEIQRFLQQLDALGKKRKD